MSNHKLTCPTCAARLKSARPLPAGQSIKCPKCCARFPASAAASNHPAPQSPDPGPPRPPSQNPEVRDAIHGPGGPNSPAAPQEPLQERERKEGNPARNRRFVVGAAVVFLVALGITLALATSGTGHQQPEPAEKAAGVEDPHKRTEASSKAAPPVPETSAERARGDEAEVLAPGEPPLTQAWLNQWIAYIEWLLDIRLTEAQCRECQQLWVQHWKETEQAKKDRFWAYANAELKWSSEAAKWTAAARDDLRIGRQLLLVADLRKSFDPDDRMLLAHYEAAHKPGGECNPILVAGTPPLTQEIVDTWRRFIEWVLDIRLTEPQRHVYQYLFINDWKKSHQAAKDNLFKTITKGLPAELPLLNEHSRKRLRAELQPKFLTLYRNSSGVELSQWLLAVYESAHEPGEDGNGVLLPGAPALTEWIAFETVGGKPIEGKYGAFAWPIVWKLRKPAGEKGGVIIQRVTITGNAWYLDDKKQKQPIPLDRRDMVFFHLKSPYAEAWQVDPGDTTPQNKYRSEIPKESGVFRLLKDDGVDLTGIKADDSYCLRAEGGPANIDNPNPTNLTGLMIGRGGHREDSGGEIHFHGEATYYDGLSIKDLQRDLKWLKEGENLRRAWQTGAGGLATLDLEDPATLRKFQDYLLRWAVPSSDGFADQGPEWLSGPDTLYVSEPSPLQTVVRDLEATWEPGERTRVRVSVTLK
jgi:hypothetical protein